MPPTINRRVLTQGPQSEHVTAEPTWNGIEECAIITKMIREKHKFFIGEAEVHPLHIGPTRIAKYRTNFMQGNNYIEFDKGIHGKRKSLATAYITVRWISCIGSTDTTGHIVTCWEPELINSVFNRCHQFGKNKPMRV